MKFLRTTLILCMLLCGTHVHLESGNYKSERNQYVDPGLWDELTPYFLPFDSAEKAILDKIFKKQRVLKSVKEMHKAGFFVITNPENKIIVAKHYKLPGYLIKVYLDTTDVHEWHWWRKRITGANLVRDAIANHGYQSFMKVPRKWIYPLPEEPSPKDKEGIMRKNFVLIVENMEILGPKDNLKAYKKQITKKHLIALYTLINECGLLDSVYADNVPFCEDGKMAFIDTEHSLNPPPYPVSHVGQYLNSKMLGIWEQIINGNIQ